MSLQTAARDLAGLLDHQAAVQPEKVALVFGDRETTYAAFNAHANKVANGLRTVAPTPQIRVALLDKNSDMFYELLFGAAKAAAVLAPVNWRLAPAEVAYIVNDAGAEVLFVGEDFFATITQILPELRTVRKVITPLRTLADTGSCPKLSRACCVMAGCTAATRAFSIAMDICMSMTGSRT
jgi:acyl-CoA synthetase (AMP-forming)/AMP-acid ligase II